MNAERLLAHYERIADAPDAIARLRRFILNLAVRGKLVPQDPNEEPASELLKRITKEKARLVKAGKIKAGKPFDAVNGDGYELPFGWALVTLGEVIDAHLGGGTPSKDNPRYWDGQVLWASVKDVGKSKYLDNTIDRISEEGLVNSSSNLIPPGNLLVVTRMGLGKVSINRVSVAINQDLRALFIAEFMSIDYCYNFFLTHGFEGTGLTVKGIKLEELLSIPFPLPPLAEQHRIVAKVDELMALCDRLEAARAERETTRDRLATASLARLNAPDPETFSTDARFVLDTLPALTTRPDQIKQLRQSILNLAVRGKLIPQDPQDKLSPVRHAHDTPEGRLNAEIPQSWRWVRVEDVADARLGKMLDKAKNKGTPYLYLRNTNVHWFDIRLNDLKEIPLDDAEFEEYRLKVGDVLICEGGHGIGRTAVWRGGPGDLVFQKALHRVRPGKYLDPGFFAQCCFVYFDAGIMQTYFTGVGIPHFTGRALAKLVFPLPPLAEQHRIVAKVDELMVLCDRLEASLTSGDDTRRRLLDALLAEALDPALVDEMETATVTGGNA